MPGLRADFIEFVVIVVVLGVAAAAFPSLNGPVMLASAALWVAIRARHDCDHRAAPLED